MSFENFVTMLRVSARALLVKKPTRLFPSEDVRRRGRSGDWLLVIAVFVACGGRTRVHPFESAGGRGGVSGSSSGTAPLGGSSPNGGSVTGGSVTGGNITGGVAGTPATGGTMGGGVGGAGAGFGGVAGVGANGGAGVGGGSGGAGDGGFGGQGGADTGVVVERLALGAFHTCAGFDDGRVRCWGRPPYNGAGNGLIIGDDETPDTVAPVDIGARVVELASSWYHTCALFDSGTVRCFGAGAFGLLGYGNTLNIGDDEAPATAGDVLLGGRVRSLGTGTNHTCAVMEENGALRCWGDNERWQLGLPSQEAIGDDEHPASVPPVVDSGVLQVAGGLGHTCALLENGTVYCWGSGSSGRLGYGNQETIGDDEPPTSGGYVSIAVPVRQLVAGAIHTCALRTDRRVVCWGSGLYGALGYGNTNDVGDDETPASVGTVDVGGQVAELAAGNHTTCAVLTNGRLRCWGQGEHGVLGHVGTENIGDDETPASAGDVDVGDRVEHVAVGFLHACALLRSGAVRCWGRGADGALGYGNVSDVGDDETPASAGDVRVTPP